jgi:UDP-N-acetylmuramoylalanine--D-glutamate ligase
MALSSKLMPIAHIIGLGQSGVAAARLLKKAGWQVTVSDRGTTQVDAAQSLISEGIGADLGYSFDLNTLASHGLARPDLMVISPGVAWHLPALAFARDQGIEMIGEVELAWRHLSQVPWVGITGTNGKTTTTALIAAIFKQAQLNAPACGNIGLSICDVALKSESVDWIIAEISSYQLESQPGLVPEVGVWTTLTPDHLERHQTLENYGATKAYLLNQAKTPVLNGDDLYLRQHYANHWTNAWWTAIDRATYPQANVYVEAGWVKVNGEPVVPLEVWQIPGHHNLQNLLMAVATAELAGIERHALVEAIQNFTGVAHRLEKIGTWHEIEFINDSKATNYDAAQIGLAAVAPPAILIAGGQSKIGDDQAWLDTIQQQAAAVLLIGEAATQFAQRLQANNYNDYEVVETLDQAVPRAAQLAQKLEAKTVLFSPACASFDQYRNFEQRGDHFRQLCQEWFDGNA